MSSEDFYDLSTLELQKPAIGSGGFGKVFKAIDKKTGKILAVKISLKLVTESSDEMINLMREVNIMSQFNHPSIINFLGYSPIDFDGYSKPVIISEFAKNKSLSQIINEQRDNPSVKILDDTQKLICIYGIASAMEYLHSHNTIHRDLKPDNILLDEFLFPKIADFGLAKILHKEFDSLTPQSIADIRGTSYYIAPEIIDDVLYSPQSDVYAFAYIVYETITMKKPFKNVKLMKIFDITSSGIRPKFPDTILPSFKKLIEDCWSNNPTDRLPFSKIVKNLEKDEGFISDTIDRKKYKAYIDYIKHCKKSFDPKKVIINPATFMKDKDVEIDEVDLDYEIKKLRADDDYAIEKVTLYPQSGYDGLSKSCQELVLKAEKSSEKKFEVAVNLIEGKNNFPKNKKLGIFYLKKSLSEGYLDPDGYGIRVLIEGKIVPRDLDNAKEVLNRSMKKSDPNFPILYGKILKKERKFDEAKNCFERAASYGSGEANYELGKMYYKGKGVDSDEKMAMKLFSRSKDNGCSKSDNFLNNHSFNKSRTMRTTKTLRSYKPVKKEIVEKKEEQNKKLKDEPKPTITKTRSNASIVDDRKKTVKRIGDVDEDQFNYLKDLFSTSVNKAIDEAEEFILDPDYESYESFLEFVKKSQKSNCCIVSWSNSMLSARCLDCQKEENSCICIPCFLAGKHDTHHSYLLGSSGAGNCDCGDPEFWKPSGNCPNHPGPDPDPDLSQMIPSIRKRFITAMKAAFCGGFLSKSEDNCSKSLNWIKNFIQFGDGLRRCASIAITSVDSQFFFEKLLQLGSESVAALIDLLGQLTSDNLFSMKMGGMLIENYLSLRKKIQEMLVQNMYNKKAKPFRPIKKFLGFSFHFFHQRPFFNLIKNKDFNWVDFVIDSIKFIFETIVKTNGDFLRLNDGHIIGEFWYLHNLINPLLKNGSEHENIQLFINKYSRLLLKYEAFFSYSIKDDEERPSNAYYIGISYLNLMIYIYKFNSFFSASFEDSADENKTFDLSETFSCLVDFLKSKDIKPESVDSDSKRVSVYPIIPLHHLFYCLLSNHKNHASIVTKLCKKKGISVQEFCSLCSIYPLRFLYSFYFPKKFSHIDSSIYRIMVYSNDHPEDIITMFFGLYQTLLGISTNKNELLLNACKTFGYENDSLFQSAIFVVSCLTDRSIISFDKIFFKRLRVIELLTRSKPSAHQLELFVDDKISNPIFADDLISYAERVRTSNGSYFKLKNESEFTPFFSLIKIDDRMNLLSNKKDKLVKIPENSDDLPKGLSFDGCFRSPLFVSLMFMLLSSKKNLAEVQVGLSMFVLSMQNGPQFDPKSYKAIKKNLTLKGQTVNDIIENLSELLNDSVNFATIKIQFGGKKPISILELVESNQSIGIEAIQKADLPIKLKLAEEDDDEIRRQKKEKAKKLKEEIMKDYETKRNIFNLGGTSAIFAKKIGEGEDGETNEKVDDEDDLFKTVSLRTSMTSSFAKSKLQCSACHDDESSDVIGFPCLSFPSIFPSLIHNKLHKLHEEIESVFSLSICTHPVHYKCCKGLYVNNTFNCMVDRCNRNCLLPYFPSKRGKIFEMKISSVLNECINKFMKKAFKEPDDYLVAVKSFAGLIVTVEVRHRNRPECLDNANVPFLLRNFLLTLYFFNKQNEISKPSKMKDTLINLTFDILNCKKPRTEFVNLVKKNAKSLKNDYLYEFLRRAAIIEDFALKEQLFTGSTNFIDWDDIFSIDSLVERYDIDSGLLKKSTELPLFETIQLSERFVSLYQPPLNLDIFDNTFSKCVDLLTGKVVVYLKNYKEKGKKTDLLYIMDYMNEFYKGGLGMFLALTGPNASDLIYSCNSMERLFNQDGFYVDQFGDIDQGFKRGAILSLSRDRLESALDKLLSGDVILY